VVSNLQCDSWGSVLVCIYLGSNDALPRDHLIVLVAARYVCIVTFPRRLQICLMRVNLRIYRRSDLHRSTFLYLPLFGLVRIFPLRICPLHPCLVRALRSPFRKQ
jgi:hypothetical protein